MSEKVKQCLNNIPYGVNTPWGETVWPAKSIPYVGDLALTNGWVILGGDVLTLECKYTYDNWYYNVNLQKPLVYNVKRSIEICLQYINQYISQNGDTFLFALTVSDSYVDGKSNKIVVGSLSKRRIVT